MTAGIAQREALASRGVRLVDSVKASAGPVRYGIVQTAWGYVGLACGGEVLCRLVLPGASEAAVERELLATLEGAVRDDGVLPELQDGLRRYFAGERAAFECEVDVSWAGEFSRAALGMCVALKPAQTVSYGRLARRVGRPNAARAVGQVMRSNRVPLVIPCHRVVGAGGALVGYSGSGGVEFKARLLEHERCFAVGGSRVSAQVSDK